MSDSPRPADGPAFEGLLASPEAQGWFGRRAVLQAMLEFEAALAAAEAEAGVIPAAAAEVIGAACTLDGLDDEALVQASRAAGSLAIPFVKALTQKVARIDPSAAEVLHWGSTSQDVIDTALVLCTRRALGVIDADLGRLIDSLLALAEAHAGTPIVGRTLLQPASVTSFGLKAAQWAAPLVRSRARLHAAGASALQLQFGGAVGTLASLGDHAARVAAGLASRLRLPPPDGAWHTQRDRWVSLGAELGVLAGSVGKVARDWSLMAQFEVGELAEPSAAGRGGSTALPHKRNPVACLAAIAAAHRAPARVAALLAAMPQEHERALGGWQAELAEWAGLVTTVHGGLSALADAAPGLVVFEHRMRANIEALQGLASTESAALLVAGVLGRPEASARMEQLARRTQSEGLHLRELLLQAVMADPRLAAAVPVDAIRHTFDPVAAAVPARRRAEEMLARLRPLAEALARAAPWPAAHP